MPFNSELNIEETRKLFEFRNRITKIPSNFGKKEEKCLCGLVETMDHIYACEFLNEMKPEINYEKLYNGNLRSQIEIFRKMETNLERRNQMRTENNVP